jgi:hypothetical protein
VAYLWMIDPVAKTLEVFERKGEQWAVALTAGGDERVRAIPFDAVELDLARWWLEDG